ncbi:hypothetical protein GCM10023322_35340 [Rugosimonospora acidiphila]|uniref:NHL repeat-containing protein n=1 Tax=Rugosimonospora acidiphila TaxID=556531 RepID=A0ABP9RW07_9ACTN
MPAEQTMPGTHRTTRPTERRTLHFDLSHLPADDDYQLQAALRTYQVHAHSAESRRDARRELGFLAAVPDHRLTHYADTELPSDAVALLQVTTRPRDDQPERLAMLGIHVPRHAYRHEQERRAARRVPGDPVMHPKLARLDVTPERYRALTGEDPAPYPKDIDSYRDASDAAVALLFHHREILNLSTAEHGAAYLIQQYCENNPGLSDIAVTIFLLGNDWTHPEPVLDQDGHQMHDEHGNLLWTPQIHPDVDRALAGPLQWAIRRIMDDSALKGSHWTVQHAVTTNDYNARVDGEDQRVADASGQVRIDLPRRPTGRDAQRSVDDRAAGADEVAWTVDNLSSTNGLSINPRVSYEPAPTTASWSASGAWAQPSSDSGDWPYASKLLAGEVYLKVISATHPDGVRIQLVPGAPSPSDETVPFTADLRPIGGSSRATLTLNALRDTLAYQLTLRGDWLRAEWVAASFCDASDTDLFSIPVVSSAGYATVTIECTNHWLRHLSLHVQFAGADGRVLTPANWDEQLPEAIRGIFQPDPTKKYLDLIPPVDTLFGVKLPARPTTVRIPVPDDASEIRLLYGGLGTGTYDPAVCGIGIATTVVCELALPVILLVAGQAITDSRPVQALLADKDLLFGVCAIAGFLVTAGVATDIAVRGDVQPALLALGKSLGPLLLKTGLNKFIAMKFAAGTAARAIPGVNLAFQIFNGVVTAAQLLQTTIDVLQSPFVYRTRVSRTVDLAVTLRPDPRTHQFPPASAGGQWRLMVLYDNDATFGVCTTKLPPTVRSEPIEVTLYACPAAGRLKVMAMFYTPEGWQAGQGQSGWVRAVAGRVTVPDVTIDTNEVPLSAQSGYRHLQKLACVDNTHRWVASAAPTDTPATRQRWVDQGKQVINWSELTLAQRPAQLATVYQARGLPDAPGGEARYTVRNLSVLDKPDRKYAVTKQTFGAPAGAVYELISPDDGTGRNFVVDPGAGTFDPVRNPAGGNHLRMVSLSSAGGPPELPTGTGPSWGRFTLHNDRYVVHPKGYIVGINYAASKMEILQLPDGPVDDPHAPFATMSSGVGFRDGLMNGPRALGCTMDGRVLVLETGNNRIQAFAVDGTPVSCFGPADAPQVWMPLRDPEGDHYLDLAVEPKGYIYVLGHSGDGSEASTYFLDVYEPDGGWLFRTTGMVAAKIAVDELRSLYTLNYEVILGPDARPEPSVSMWLPRPPAVRH